MFARVACGKELLGLSPYKLKRILNLKFQFHNYERVEVELDSFWLSPQARRVQDRTPEAHAQMPQPWKLLKLHSKLQSSSISLPADGYFVLRHHHMGVCPTRAQLSNVVHQLLYSNETRCQILVPKKALFIDLLLVMVIFYHKWLDGLFTPQARIKMEKCT